MLGQHAAIGVPHSEDRGDFGIYFWELPLAKRMQILLSDAAIRLRRR